MTAARVRWRYLVVGLGFLGLAGARAAQGAPVWAVVFLAAAAVNGWLAVQEAARDAQAPQTARAPRAAQDPQTPHARRTTPADAEPVQDVNQSEVDRSLAAHRTSARQWQVLGVAGVLLGGGLLALEPALSVFAAAAALFALHRARRAGRSAATLERVSGGPAIPAA